ncbi:hypothetical protein [Streptomyces niveus]|uniref:hypothetical protein n=1 Tax=Streptomyces niveus TaxID=193462 RepID=UPI00340322FE
MDCEAFAQATAPAGSEIAVHGTPELLALGLGGVLIAVLGALPPAGWAGRTRTE